MRLNEIVKENTEQNESIGNDLELTTRAYKQIINDLKSKQVGDRRASAAKDMVMGMWEKGDRLVGSYKSIIKDFDIGL